MNKLLIGLAAIVLSVVSLGIYVALVNEPEQADLDLDTEL